MGQRTAPHRVVLAVAITLLLVGVLPSVALVYGDANHEGWPDIVVYKSHPEDQNGALQGTNRSDELLGGHGNDTIYGRSGADVIWGDFKPCCQPSSQHDVLYGGQGNDFIYASHGKNNINAGSGNDVIHAHYGASGGSVDCGSGNDLLFVSHKRKSHYSIHNCERLTYKHEGK
jgi:Ca2+-binding RTX toxin-like protein